MTKDYILGRRHWIKHLIAGGITLVCLLIFFRQIDYVQTVAALKDIDWIYIIFGVISLFFGYAARIFRWSIMLKAADSHITFRNCIAPFLGSVALNNVLPLRLGDLIRALVFPKSMGITKTTATSSLIVERLIDLMSLLLSFTIGLYAIKSITIPTELKTSAITLASIGSLVLFGGFLFSKRLGDFFKELANSQTPERLNLKTIHQTIASLLHSFNIMSRPRILITMLAVSMLVWIGEAGLYYFVLLGIHADGSIMIALLVMAIATLSTLIPSSPGYIGPFHLAAFTAISSVGGSGAQAGTYAIIVHLALWLSTTVAGAIAIWSQPDLFKSVKSINQLILKSKKAENNG